MRDRLAIIYVVGQIVAFVAFIIAGRTLVPEFGEGAMDWIVTAAYGQIMLVALLVTAVSRQWRLHTCVQALAFVYVSNVVVSIYDPGMIGQGMWLLFWPLSWACAVVHQLRMALMMVPAVISATVMYVQFGVRIDPGENAYPYEVVNNLLHQLPLLYAGATALTRTRHARPAEIIPDRKREEKRAA